MGVGTVIASTSSLVLISLATVGWVIFITGFGIYNKESRFFELVDTLSPEAREVIFLSFNSHYIVAAITPILFIVMIVMSFLTMLVKNKWMPYITAIMSGSIVIMGAFVMISSGVVLYLYGLVITSLRLGLTPQPTGQGEIILNATHAMFAGMLVVDLFLTGALILTFIGAILAARDHGKSVD